MDGVSANVGAILPALRFGAGVAGGTASRRRLGTTQSMVSVDALQEFRASTSTYCSEYGRTPGGQFAFTTRSGTNGWHGTLFDYFRNEAMDANNWFNDETLEPREKERQNDFGGTLGGPLFIPGLYNGKDKTFFFFSYEGLRLWTPQPTAEVGVPDATLRSSAPVALQPFLNAFPVANAGEDGFGDGFAYYRASISDPSSIDSVSVRVDHSFGNKFKVFGRYADTPTVTTNFGTAIQEDSIVNNRTLTLGMTSAITPRQVNEFRFNFTNSYSRYNEFAAQLGGGSPLSSSILPGLNGQPFPATGYAVNFELFFGQFTGLGLEENHGSQHQYNLTDSYSWTVGRHNFKFGADWRRLGTHFIPSSIQEGTYFFSEQALLNNTPDETYVTNGASAAIDPVYKNFSSFAQDEWKATSRLSVSLGLRWDINPAPTNADGLSPYTVDQVTDIATVKLAPAGTPLWHTEWGAFAPRIGLAYQFRQTPGHETVFRGGFGKFFDMGNTLGSIGFGRIGFSSSAYYFGVPFPLTSEQVTLPAPSIAPPYNNGVYGFDPHLKLPYTLEWNFAIEQALGSNNALTVTYVGSGARNLLSGFQYYPENLGNPNFSASVCAGCLTITKNTPNANSDYDALQVQFQRKLSHGLQFLSSYTWSHSLDSSSVNGLSSEFERASSDFDLRHNFQAALTYDVPGSYSNPVLAGLLKHWGLDTRVTAHSALPVDVTAAYGVDLSNQTQLTYHPDRVPGVPLYLYGSEYPGGKAINYSAFVAVTDSSGNPVEGDAGRNAARGFGVFQTNFALRREFPIREGFKLQFRAEAFNVFNHPTFSNVYNYLGYGPCGPGAPGQSLFCFGVSGNTLNTYLQGANSLYQVGGPRSLQVALKLVF